MTTIVLNQHGCNRASLAHAAAGIWALEIQHVPGRGTYAGKRPWNLYCSTPWPQTALENVLRKHEIFKLDIHVSPVDDPHDLKL